MKKNTKIIKMNNPYEIAVIIDNTALVNSLDGKFGLMNIKNNKIIDTFENYDTVYDIDRKFYIQQKSDENTSMPQKYKKIRIYDTEKEKFIIENYKLINVLYNSIYLYSDGNENHIFDPRYYRKNNDSINDVYESVEEFEKNYYGEYLIVTKNEKKGIYKIGKGLIVPCVYDEISKNDYTIIYNKDKKQFFSNIEFSNISSEYDLITEDKINSVIYCKKDNIISIYSQITKRKISDFCCDEIKYIRLNREDNLYIYRKDNKYGIVHIGSEDKKTSNKNKILISNEYDEIVYSGNGIFYLKKDNKYGLYNFDKKVVIEPKYDSIKQTILYNIYLLYNGDSCDIVNVKKNKILVENCQCIENYSREIKYSKDNYFGLIVNDGDFKIIEKYDKIEYLDDHLFLLQIGNNKGICKEGNIIIPIKYEEIEQICCKTSMFSDSIFFKLKCSDGCYKLATIKSYLNSPSDVEYDQGYSDDIQLFPDILVLKNNNCTCIFNYCNKLLSMIDGCVDVSLIKMSDKRLYFIEGNYYIYKDNKFIMLPSELCDLYETVYESANGNVIVSSFNKREHDYVCEEIEAGGEENIDKTIENIYKENSKFKDNYPVLVKKIEHKKSMD